MFFKRKTAQKGDKKDKLPPELTSHLSHNAEITKVQACVRGWIIRNKFAELVGLTQTLQTLSVELLFSEKRFVKALANLQQVFHVALMEVVSAEEQDSLFSFVPAMSNTHIMVLADLEDAVNNKQPLGKIIKSHFQALPWETLSQYMANYYTKAVYTCEQISSSPKGTAALAKVELDEEFKGLTLAEMLQVPITHLDEYASWLQDVREVLTGVAEPKMVADMTAPIKEAQGKVDGVKEEVTLAQSERERRDEVSKVLLQFKDGEVGHLQMPGRYFVTQGTVVKKHHRNMGGSKKYHLMLFSDILVTADPEKKGFALRKTIPLGEVHLQDKGGNCFDLICDNQHTMNLTCESQAQKDLLIQTMTTAVLRLFKLTESSKAVDAAVAYGQLHRVQVGSIHSAALLGDEDLLVQLISGHGKQCTPKDKRSSKKPQDTPREGEEWDISSTDDQGCTALHLACHAGHANIVHHLLAAGIAADVTDKKGLSPLHLASMQGSSSIVDQLIQSGVEPSGRVLWSHDTPEKEIEAPLILATMHKHLDVVQMLLQHRVPLNRLDKESRTALFIAVADGSKGIAQALLASDADPNLPQTDTGLAPLHVVMSNPDPDPELWTALISHGADVNAKDKTRGYTPLSCAMMAACPSPAAVSALLQAGAHPNMPDKRGKKALWLLNEAGGLDLEDEHQEVASLLVAHGARHEEHLPKQSELAGAVQARVFEDSAAVFKRNPKTPKFVEFGGLVQPEVRWMPDEEASTCSVCGTTFTEVVRRHHCRATGLVVCGACSSKKAILPHVGDKKPVRVCDAVFNLLCAKEEAAVSQGMALKEAAVAEEAANTKKETGKNEELAEYKALLEGGGPSTSGATSSQGRDRGRESKSPQAAQSGAAGAHSAAHEAVQALHERGEALQRLDQKVAVMHDEAQNFYETARKLREQQEKNSKWW